MVTIRWRLDATDIVIQQHVIKGHAVLPFASWLNRCFAAVTAAQSMPPHELTRVVVARPLMFADGGAVAAQFVGRPDAGAGRFEVREEAGSTDRPQPGVPLVEGAWQNAADADWLAERGCGGPALDHEAFYLAASKAGYDYGPRLRRIKRMQVDQARWMADLTPAIDDGDSSAARETAWDALLQTGAVLAATQTDACWVPFAIDRARLATADAGRSIDRLCGEWIADSPRSSERVANISGFGTGDTAPRLELRGVHYRVLETLPSNRVPTGFGAASGLGDVRPDNILELIRSAAPRARRPLLVRFIEDQLLEILQLDKSKRSELAAGFAAVGVDSLSSLDLQYRLQTALAFALPLGESFDQPTADALAAALLDKHLKFDRN